MGTDGAKVETSVVIPAVHADACAGRAVFVVLARIAAGDALVGRLGAAAYAASSARVEYVCTLETRHRRGDSGGC